MDENTVRDALAAGSALSEPRFVGIGAYAVVPEDYELVSLEPYAESPTRKHGSVEMHDVDSFIRYFNTHAAEHSQIYATVNPPRFVGVLNDHEQKKAGWRDFCVTYNCPISIEWREWAECDGKPMKQVEFADFIERNLPDIVEPAGADMLEISRTLEAKKKVNFSSGIRLQNGQQELTYEEEIKGTSARGKLQIPETFALGIPVFEGGDPYKVEARLRYRISDATLIMWYELVRPHKIVDDAVTAYWNHIQKQTKRTIYRGKA